MPKPGPGNTICDVPGIFVGNAENRDLMTGVTVILPGSEAVCAVDHRGGGIGARDTVLLDQGSTVGGVHAICLSGGSAYGLDAAGGVMHGLRTDGRGFAVGPEIVPIVPAAIIFDLLCGAPKEWDRPPWWDLGLKAYQAAGPKFALGNAGAGTGATAGPLKGGLGSASYRDGSVTVGALAVANPVGSAVIPGTDTFWGWMLGEAGELGNQSPPGAYAGLHDKTNGPPLANTTLAVVATDARLTKDQAKRIAIMAQDGLARAIRPVHGPMDGDTVFVLSTGEVEADTSPAGLTRLGTLAGDAVVRAVMRGVYEAESVATVSSYRDRHGR